MQSSIHRDIAYNLAGTAVSFLVNVSLAPIIIAKLGSESFGIYTIATSLIAFFAILDFGISKNLSKQVAEYQSITNTQDSGTLVNVATSVASVLYFFCLILASLVSFVALYLAEYIFDYPKNQELALKFVLMILLIQASLGFPMSIWRSVLVGLGRFRTVNAVEASMHVVRLALITITLEYYSSIEVVAGCSLIVFTVSALLMRFHARRILPSLDISLQLFSWNKAKNLVEFGSTMTLWSIAGQISTHADRLILASCSSLHAVSVYDIGARINLYSRLALGSFSSVFFVAAASLNQASRKKRLRILYIRATRNITGIYCCIALPLLLFGHEIVLHWIGPSFSSSAHIMFILVIGSIYQCQSLVAHIMLPAMNELLVFRRIMLCYVFAIPSLGLILSNTFGAIGMAIAITSSTIFLETIFLGYALQIFDIRFKLYSLACHRPIILATLTAITPIFIVRLFVEFQSAFALSLGIAGCTTIYFFFFLKFGFSSVEKRKIQRKISNLMHYT